jgi:hypothetical protein
MPPPGSSTTIPTIDGDWAAGAIPLNTTLKLLINEIARQSWT